MSYTPTEWETADIVTATRMNALETAVGDMNMSYTPNTWSDGDILTAAKMNALEQAVASGGGGGSSDFSTATVTFINSGSSENPYIYSGIQATESGIMTTYSNETAVVVDSSVTVTIPLYKGVCIQPLLGIFSYIDDSVMPSATGGVSLDFQTYVVTITGDGTITAKGAA